MMTTTITSKARLAGERLLAVLDDPAFIRVLYLLNAVAAAGMVVLTWKERGGDWATYHGLAVGILHGAYSYWTHLGLYVPDTFRTPGYPLLVAAVLKVFGAWEWLKIVQLGLYAVAVGASLGVVRNIGGGRRAVSIFLLILLPSLNLPYYIGTMLPEIAAAAAVVGAAYVLTLPSRRLSHAVLLGFLHGVVFQLRPSFLLFPPAYFAFTLLRERRAMAWRMELVTLACFAVTLLPYGMWNLSRHGVFKVAPIEGGGGAFHTGYWAGRIPGFHERRYWGNIFGDEIVEFVPRDRRAVEIEAFTAEWDAIDAELAPLLTEQDAAMLAARTREPALFPTWNSAYSIARERLLTEYTVRNIRNNMPYYVAWKAYSTVRLWVTGVMREQFTQASLRGRLAMLYPTTLMALQLLLAVVAIPLAYRRGVVSHGQWLALIFLLVYWTSIHIPFVIQARYTVPVRLVLFALTATALDRLLPRWQGTGGA